MHGKLSVWRLNSSEKQDTCSSSEVGCGELGYEGGLRPIYQPQGQFSRVAIAGDVAAKRDRSLVPERPEEPAKYIYEIPKLGVAEILTSAVLCGNWLAQLRQIFAGLSPTAVS